MRAKVRIRGVARCHDNRLRAGMAPSFFGRKRTTTVSPDFRHHSLDVTAYVLHARCSTTAVRHLHLGVAGPVQILICLLVDWLFLRASFVAFGSCSRSPVRVLGFKIVPQERYNSIQAPTHDARALRLFSLTTMSLRHLQRGAASRGLSKSNVAWSKASGMAGSQTPMHEQ